MTKNEQLTYLLKLNETGNTSVIESIIRLIMDGYEVTFMRGEVTGIEDSPGGKRVITDQGEYLARSVIITVGARRRELEAAVSQAYKELLVEA